MLKFRRFLLASRNLDLKINRNVLYDNFCTADSFFGAGRGSLKKQEDKSNNECCHSHIPVRKEIWHNSVLGKNKELINS